MEGFGWYTYEIAKRLVENHPEHDFIFLFDRPFDEKFVFAKNVEPVVINPPARHPFLFYLWFEFGVKKALKKHKGKRRDASLDLGISERTLYRKLKEYDIED